MDYHCYEIDFPQHTRTLDQNEEYITLKSGDQREKLRLHDYCRFYKIPGLYEEVLYNRLKCCSPQTLCKMLHSAMDTQGTPDEPLRVLDFGAGNGVAGEQIKENMACNTIVGVDILKDAKAAALRDRPELYDDYMVADFNNLNAQERDRLESYDFNVLLSVAALGYDHIGTEAFLNAFEMVCDDAWVAFNIKDRFLSDDDPTGFKDMIVKLARERLRVLEAERYVHRLSISQEPLYYVGIVGKKY